MPPEPPLRAALNALYPPALPVNKLNSGNAGIRIQIFAGARQPLRVEQFDYFLRFGRSGRFWA